MATLNRLKAGQVLYVVTRERMGNTTVSRGVLRTVTVVAVNLDQGLVVAHYEGSRAPRQYTARQVKAWKVNKPEPRGERFGLPNY